MSREINVSPIFKWVAWFIMHRARIPRISMIDVEISIILYGDILLPIAYKLNETMLGPEGING